VAAQLLDIFAFLSVLLRGTALALESLVVGGAAFTVWILQISRDTAGTAGS
jgi:nitrate reductase NapE component